MKKLLLLFRKKWIIILPFTIGVLIGWFYAETLFGGFFYDIGHRVGEWIGSTFFFKLVPLKTIR